MSRSYGPGAVPAIPSIKNAVAEKLNLLVAASQHRDTSVAEGSP